MPAFLDDLRFGWRILRKSPSLTAVRGREFTPPDEGRRDAAILDRATARYLWPGGEDPIGQKLTFGNEKPRTVIGLVADVKNLGLDLGTGTQVYVPYAEEPTVFPGLAVRTVGDPGNVAGAIRAAVRSLDPNQPVDFVSSMREILDGEVVRPRFNLVVLGSFAALAMVLAVVGIYGLVAYSVTERTHEIGIRMALGAERAAVLRLVVGRGALLAACGIALGLAASLAATRVLGSFLFGVTPHDGATFAAVACVLMTVCLAASYLPARRAARVDPMVALRHE